MPSFRGASADAVAALEEVVGSTLGSSKAAATVGDDLFAVAATLRSEGALRRFLADASVPTEARTGLVGQVFGGKVDTATLELLTDAVSRRWTTPRDLVDGLEHLSVVAQVTSAGADSGRLSDELFAFAQAVKATPELRDALSDPVRSDGDKAALVDSILAASALPATVSLAKQALAGSHHTVAVALTEYQKVAASTHGQGVATVRVAHELSAGDQQRLAAALERQYGRSVHLNLLVDPQVIGGIRIEIGDDVIDGTVASRLEDARRSLAG